MVKVTEHTAEFSFFRPQAERVCVVGDFNGWSMGRTPMVRGDGGHWRASVQLPDGDFRFRYHADGEWFVDYAAFGLDCGPFGPDSIVHAPVERRAPAPRMSLAAAG